MLDFGLGFDPGFSHLSTPTWNAPAWQGVSDPILSPFHTINFSPYAPSPVSWGSWSSPTSAPTVDVPAWSGGSFGADRGIAVNWGAPSVPTEVPRISLGERWLPPTPQGNYAETAAYLARRLGGAEEAVPWVDMAREYSPETARDPHMAAVQRYLYAHAPLTSRNWLPNLLMWGGDIIYDALKLLGMKYPGDAESTSPASFSQLGSSLGYAPSFPFPSP